MISAAKAAVLGAALALGSVLSAPLYAADRPLLAEGRKTVYQRVLTRPGALRFAAPDGDATNQYPAFQPLYVFERQDGWMRVGPSISQAAESWVRADQVVDWKQNIVAAFTNTAGRKRQLLFEDEARLFP